MNALVTYFSASGSTGRLARTLAAAANADFARVGYTAGRICNHHNSVIAFGMTVFVVSFFETIHINYDCKDFVLWIVRSILNF
jgi:flavodoxin